jgi:hypothetical protein
VRNYAQIGFLIFVLCGSAIAQQPVPGSAPVQTPDQPTSQPTGQPTGQPVAPNPNADPRDNRQRPLTPEEERELEIRQFDPLYHGDPNAPFQTTPDTNPNGGPPVQEQTQQPQPKSNSLDAPVPGSIASGERLNAAAQNAGPKVIGDNDQGGDSQEYTGPAVLSRAYTVNRPMMDQDVKWMENFGLGFSLITGATSGALSPTGTLASSPNQYGLSFTGAFGGRKVFHRDQLGIRVATQYQLYFPSSGVYNGPNINMAVDYSHVISRRLTLNLVGTSTIFSQGYTLQNPVINPDISMANINLASSPNIQIFDSSTKQFNLQASLTYQLNARISFNFGGSYFAVIRDNPFLIGAGGEQAQGDVNYRWTKKTTVGVYYSYSYYQFQHGAGTSDTNTLGLIYSYAFSRTLQFRLRGGASTTESLGLQAIPLNPVIAALLGETSTIIDLFRNSATSDISAQLVKDFNGGRTASIAFVNGVSPGNGLFQTSKQQSISINFGAKIRRVYQIQVAVSHDSLTSIAQTIGGYTGENAQISFSRAFRGGFASNLNMTYRHVSISGGTPLSAQYGFTSGISWSPPNGKVWPF